MSDEESSMGQTRSFGTLLDRILENYESDLKKNSAPDISAVLNSIPEDLQSVALTPLISLDVSYRFNEQNGGCSADDYRALGHHAVDIAAKEIIKLEGAAPKPARLPTGELESADLKVSAITLAPTGKTGNEDTFTLAEDVNHSQRFKILRHLASGGLGHVSVADDEELEREVAVKEMRAEYAKDPDARRRFELEALITGGLEHPGVVPVYGFGKKVDGSPYIAMRYIKGETLRKAVKNYHENHDTLNAEERVLEFRNLLTRFVDTCNAIGFAHSKGVIHRDIKPDNIMLGSYGETLVVDWGLAKKVGSEDVFKIEDEKSLMLRQSVLSRTLGGSTLGTVPFMSPEQAEGRMEELRQASDIYSLGSTLFYILTGEPPYTGKDIVSVLSLVRENRYLPPISVDVNTPKPLNSICCKAMQKVPMDRYETALLLASDVEKWLAGEKAVAHQETLFEKSARWIRNNQTVAAAAGILLLTVAIASIFGTLFVNNERNKTVSAQQETLAALEREKDARQATGDLLNSVATDLIDAHGKLMSRQMSLDSSDRAYFSDLVDRFRNFTKDSDQSPTSQSIKAEGLITIGNLHRRLDQTKDATAAFAEAEDTLRSLISIERSPKHSLQLARLKSDQGVLFAEENKLDDAVAVEGQAIEILRSLDEKGSELACAIQLAGTLVNRGNTLLKQGKNNLAESDYIEAIQLFEKLLNLKQKVNGARSGYAIALSALGNLLAKTKNRLPESRKWFEKCIETLRESEFDGDSRPYETQRQLAREMRNLGLVLRKLGQNADALAQLRSAVAIQVGLADRYPAISQCRSDLCKSKAELGRILLRSKRRQTGLSELRESVSLAERLHEDFPGNANYTRVLAEILGDLAKYDDSHERSVEFYQKSTKLRNSIAANGPEFASQAVGAEVNFALYLLRKNKLETALARFQSAEENIRDIKNPNPEITKRIWLGLAETHNLSEQYSSSLSYWEKLAADKEDENWHDYELSVGICKIRTGKIEEGVEIVDQFHKAKSHDPIACYNCGCYYAIAASLTNDKEVASAYAEKAIRFIREAGEKEFFTPAMKSHVASDKDLNPLRELESFKKLCRDFGLPLKATDL
ncbi:serine/threonine-protein kinase [Mariniblastus sp.]|nr:serine/threonine-protein kinase [Mariniblastus sp.]